MADAIIYTVEEVKEMVKQAEERGHKKAMEYMKQQRKKEILKEYGLHDKAAGVEVLNAAEFKPFEDITDPQEMAEFGQSYLKGKALHPTMRPAHYNNDDIETIDFINQTVKHYPASKAYEVGNAIKYLARAPHKGALLDDIDKAINHLYRASHGVWLNQKQSYKLTAAQKEQLEIFQAIQTEIKVVNGDPDEAEYIGNHVMELIKEYEREYLKMGKKKSAKKDEMIQVIKSVMQNELMHDVITEKELEKVLRNLSKPMQRSLEEAERRKREN